MMDLVKEAQDNKEALESKKKIILSAIVAGIVIAAAVPFRARGYSPLCRRYQSSRSSHFRPLAR